MAGAGGGADEIRQNKDLGDNIKAILAEARRHRSRNGTGSALQYRDGFFQRLPDLQPEFFHGASKTIEQRPRATVPERQQPRAQKKRGTGEMAACGDGWARLSELEKKLADAQLTNLSPIRYGQKSCCVAKFPEAMQVMHEQQERWHRIREDQLRVALNDTTSYLADHQEWFFPILKRSTAWNEVSWECPKTVEQRLPMFEHERRAYRQQNAEARARHRASPKPKPKRSARLPKKQYQKRPKQRMKRRMGTNTR